MDYIEGHLCRLQENLSRFVLPSGVSQDVRILKAQIELRQQALRDIEAIRCRLRPFMCGKSKLPNPRRLKRRTWRSRIGVGRFRRPL